MDGLIEQRHPSLARALELLAAVRAEAEARSLQLAMCVVDAGGHVIASQRMDGAALGAITTALLVLLFQGRLARLRLEMPEPARELVAPAPVTRLHGPRRSPRARRWGACRGRSFAMRAGDDWLRPRRFARGCVVLR